MEAPDNAAPLQPKSALSEQRHLLLVHEPSHHTKKEAGTRNCLQEGKGRHPLTPRGQERGLTVGVAAEPPRAALSKHRQVYLWSRKAFVS